MYPFFKDGDLVSSVIYHMPESSESLKPGVVYLTKDDSEWVLHRCVVVNGQRALKGDWSAHTHKAKFIWGEAQCSRSLLNTLIARVSVLNMNSNKFFRCSSKLVLICLAFLCRFNRPS